MPNIEKAFVNHTHIDKIRIAKFVTQTIVSTNPEVNAKNGTMNTVLGLLAKGDLNCAGDPIDASRDLFGTKQHAPTEQRTKGRQATETPPGVVRTEAEKQQAEEEARRRKEEEERIAKEKAEEEARRIAEEKKENSPLNKGLNWFKKVAAKLTDPEE